MNKPLSRKLLALLILAMAASQGPLHGTPSRTPAGQVAPNYLSDTPQAHLIRLPGIFDFYANFFSEVNAHSNIVSGEDYDKIKSFINSEIKLAQSSEFQTFLDREVTPYLKDLPDDTLRLQDPTLFLRTVSQKFSFLSEIIETQISVFKNQGSIALAQNYINSLNSQALAQSLIYLLHNRSEHNSSTFMSLNKTEIKPYLLKILVLKTSEQLPHGFSQPRPAQLAQNPNTLVNFNKILSHIEFQSSQKLRTLTLEVQKNASL